MKRKWNWRKLVPRSWRTKLGNALNATGVVIVGYTHAGFWFQVGVGSVVVGTFINMLYGTDKK